MRQFKERHKKPRTRRSECERGYRSI